MTSTNVFMGLNDGRNSSRVLRPPGGGQTDVLGLKSGPEEPIKRGNPRNESSIIVGTDEVKPVVKPKVQVQVPENPPENTGNDGAQKSRVPPGGFSSGGFW